MSKAEHERTITLLTYYGEKLGCKDEFDLAIKALRIVDVIEAGFKRDSNLIMDSDDWEDIKALAEKAFSEEAENETDNRYT